MDIEFIEPEKTEESGLPENEKNSLFMNLLLGKEATKKAETSRGEFTIKYIKPDDLLAIGRVMAYNRNGLSVSCFDALSERRNMVLATLEVAVLDGPPWYKNVKAEKGAFNWGAMPDYAFCEELYETVYTFRNELQKDLEAPGKKPPVGVSAAGSDDDIVDAGAFSGIAGGSAGA